MFSNETRVEEIHLVRALDVPIDGRWRKVSFLVRRSKPNPVGIAERIEIEQETLTLYESTVPGH